jgi:hypothetical protein
MVQDKKKEKSGVQGILSEYPVYIDMCASYMIMPYLHLLENMEKKTHGLIGHSNAGLCWMDTNREMGTVMQMWLNEGGVVPPSSLSRSSRRSGQSCTTPDALVESLSSTPTRGTLSSKITARECCTLIFTN